MSRLDASYGVTPETEQEEASFFSYAKKVASVKSSDVNDGRNSLIAIV